MDILAREFVSCTARWGLTVSTSKTKVMALGDDSALCGIHLESGGVIDQVPSFTYLSGSTDDNGSLDGKVAVQLAKASRVSGSLQMPISQYKPLSIRTKRLVYTTIVLTTLFYGAETWALKATHLQRLNVFHHVCSRAILGVCRSTQWQDRLTSEEIAKRVRLPADIGELLWCHRLRWLGHIARMDSSCLPKQVLFGELLSRGPSHGPRKR